MKLTALRDKSFTIVLLLCATATQTAFASEPKWSKYWDTLTPQQKHCVSNYYEGLSPYEKERFKKKSLEEKVRELRFGISLEEEVERLHRTGGSLTGVDLTRVGPENLRRIFFPGS